MNQSERLVEVIARIFNHGVVIDPWIRMTPGSISVSAEGAHLLVTRERGLPLCIRRKSDGRRGSSPEPGTTNKTRTLGRALIVGAFWAFALQGSGYAHVTDGHSHPPVNYATLVPPPAGQSYVDPVFGTAITRLSDALQTPDHADTGMLLQIVNEYSTMTPFNSDNSRIVIQHRSYFALYDRSGRYIEDLPLDITAASEPRWSRRDPYVLYYVTGNRLRQYNTATHVASTLHTFAEYSVVSGRGESDICFDGDHLVLVGDYQNVFVYELSTETKGPVLATAALGGFDNVYITPDDHVLVSWYASGNERYHGVEVYNRSMDFLGQASSAMGHMDVTRDTNGDEVLLIANAADPNPLAGCPNGLVKIRLATGQRTCLVSFDWSLAFHVSAPDGNGWVVLSTYSVGDPNPLTKWAPYMNEILEVKLDGSEIRRLAHHRSRPFGYYWWTPRAAVSRDGTRAVFSSNYGLPGSLGFPVGYADVYFIDLSSVAPTLVGSELPIRTRIEQNDPSVSSTCPPNSAWYFNSYWRHSGGNAALAMTAGCRATLTFSGTGVRWIGYADEWSGLANVYIDGVSAATVDTFSSPSQAQTELFSTTGLPSDVHTFAVEPAGRAGPQAGGAWVWVDAFDVAVRIEQDDGAVQYGCFSPAIWTIDTQLPYSSGSAALADAPGCLATFAFTGTAVSWIGGRGAASGIARVSIDGVFRAEIDTYAGASEQQMVLYTIAGLPTGPHTMTIEPTGRQDPWSAGATIRIDAFEVLR